MTCRDSPNIEEGQTWVQHYATVKCERIINTDLAEITFTRLGGVPFTFLITDGQTFNSEAADHYLTITAKYIFVGSAGSKFMKFTLCWKPKYAPPTMCTQTFKLQDQNGNPLNGNVQIGTTAITVLGTGTISLEQGKSFIAVASYKDLPSQSKTFTSCTTTTFIFDIDKCVGVVCDPPYVCTDLGHKVIRECDPDLGICVSTRTELNSPDCEQPENVLDKVVDYVSKLLPDIDYSTIYAALSKFSLINLTLYLVSKTGPVYDWIVDQTVTPDEYETMLNKVAVVVSGLIPHMSFAVVSTALRVFSLTDLTKYLIYGTGAVYDWVMEQIPDKPPEEPPLEPPIDKCTGVVCDPPFTCTDQGYKVVRECDPDLGICVSSYTESEPSPDCPQPPDKPIDKCVGVVCEDQCTDLGHKVIRECDPYLGICQSVETIKDHPDCAKPKEDEEDNLLLYAIVFIGALAMFKGR